VDLLVTRDEGGFHVVAAKCTHRGCIVDFDASSKTWECPCHGSRYRLRDGLVVRGPAVFDQPHYEVRQADGKIEVRRTDTR